MGKYWILLAEYDAESTTWSEAAGAAAASPFTPPEDARLIGLRTIPNRDAQTTLANHVQWRLTSRSFQPAQIEVGSQNSGLQTAPALQAPFMDWPVDQMVRGNNKVTIEGRNVTADTPVTVCEMLYGCFVSGGGGGGGAANRN